MDTGFFIFLIMMALFILYFAPAIIAWRARHPQATAIYDLSGVSTRWTCKGRGACKTPAMAKRSFAKAWDKWLARAGLKPITKRKPR